MKHMAETNAGCLSFILEFFATAVLGDNTLIYTLWLIQTAQIIQVRRPI